MKKHLLSRILSLVLAAALVAGFAVPVNAAGVSWKVSEQEVSLELSDRQVPDTAEASPYQPTDIVRVSIILEDKPTIQAGYSTLGLARNEAAMAYSASLERKQETLEKKISAQVLGGKELDVVWNLTLAGNLISANVPYGKIQAIEALDGVQSVYVEKTFAPAVASRDETVQPQMYTSAAMIGSRDAWASGYTGAGSRIAIIDTGTDTDHQSFDNGAFLYSLEQNAQAAGVSYADYVDGLNLLDAGEIAGVLPKLNVHQSNPDVTAQDLYLGAKLAFGYNYSDSSLDVTHDNDWQGEHGSHVAGIATANRYIPQGDGYVDAAETVYVCGVAPDAQLITMKVFGSTRAGQESDYLAAVEDAILLGCDVVNLSMGTASAGSPYNALLDYLTGTDTVVTISAGNAYSWVDYTYPGYLYSEDVNLDMVSEPGSYTNALTVASVENSGTVNYNFTVGDLTIAYNEVSGFSNTPMYTMDTSADASGTQYEYVLIDGMGDTSDYEGMDLTGKVVFCPRGTLTFAAKANNAVSLGAAAVVLYNNTSGSFNPSLSGYWYSNPVVAILQSEGDAIRAASTQQTTEAGITYYTGEMTVNGRKTAVYSTGDYYTMSDFSAWGVPGDLSLKPELTAPGGRIYSVYGSTPLGGGSDQYETMSGTSMAAPQMAGMVALMAQYIRDNGLDETTGLSPRQLAQSLLMSTAEPLYEEASGGNYYSLLKQGAGLGRVDLAAAAHSYVLVDGQDDGKVKAELGDDPDRTGSYTFSFSLNNLTGEDRDYALSADVFTQDVLEYGELYTDFRTRDLPAYAAFTADGAAIAGAAAGSGYDLNGDGQTDALDAGYLLEYLLGSQTVLHAGADVNGDGQVNTYDAHLLLVLVQGGKCVTVPAGGSVTVEVTLTLTQAAREFLEESYPNGGYVQAFVYAQEVADEEGNAGTCHSIPVLAFYGNWSDASMFDKGSYAENIVDMEKVPYLYYGLGEATNFLSVNYGSGQEYYFGGNPVVYDDAYLPQRNAMNNQTSDLERVYFSLIRNAEDARLTVTDAETGEVYLERDLGSLDAAYFEPASGGWYNVLQQKSLKWSGTDSQGNPLPEGTTVNVSLTAIPAYYRNGDGSYDLEALGRGASFTTQVTIDNTAPQVQDIVLDVLRGDTLRVTAQDNEYVAAVVLRNAAGNTVLAYNTPNQTEKGVSSVTEVDLTGLYGTKFQVSVYDYAYNVATYEVEMDLGEQYRPYFTCIGYQIPQSNGAIGYIGYDTDGTGDTLGYYELGACPGKASPRAAEYVDGYVFEITVDNELYVGRDEDLTDFRYLTRLTDPTGEYIIQEFYDLAYNTADGRLYALFRDLYQTSCLATIDMFSGELTVLCRLPQVIHNLAIDDEGNFYGIDTIREFWSPGELYTFTLDQVLAEEPTMTDVGPTIASYYLAVFNEPYVTSLAWDHNEGKLYWGYPDTLVLVDHETAACTIMNYYYIIRYNCGLYIRPSEGDNRFAPVDTVDSVTVTPGQTRLPVGQKLSLLGQVWPWNVTDGSVTWTSSNEAVATVDETGRVTGRAEGAVTITATSNLDPSKSASCTLSVEKLDKQLNAVVWDEEGQVWWSEFRVDSLPGYTKLTGTPSDVPLASATLAPDGTIYGGTLDSSGLVSDLYTVDPDTFQATRVGSCSGAGYTDLAYAPQLDCLMATYGGNILLVDPATGDYMDYFYMFYYPLVGITYANSGRYVDEDYGWDCPVDWFIIIDSAGYVYYLGFLEMDGYYYYLEDEVAAPGGILGMMDMEVDTDQFCSAYYDGEAGYVYWAAYSESADNVTLLTLDVTNGNCYKLGTFADRVWPVAGLMELKSGDASTGSVLPETGSLCSAPRMLETGAVPSGPESRPAKADGGLQSVTLRPQSNGTAADGQASVSVTPVAASTNGILTVTYDPQVLTLTGVNGSAPAFAYSQDEGVVVLAYASAGVVAAGQAVAALTFAVAEDAAVESTVLTVTQGECGQEILDASQTVTLALPHRYTAVVTAPTCTEGGYTTYTCDICGDTYVGDYTEALGHTWGEWELTEEPTCFHDGVKTRTCQVCGETETEPVEKSGENCPSRDFADLDVSKWYHEGVDYVLREGLMVGMGGSLFAPNAEMTRAQLVTVLYRMAGSPDVAAETPFTDVAEGAWYAEAVAWAYGAEIAKGVTETLFVPGASVTREQMVTFFARFARVNGVEVSCEGDLMDFTDANQVSGYAVESVTWAYEAGLIRGMGDNTIAPKGSATRAQVATILMRYCEIFG